MDAALIGLAGVVVGILLNTLSDLARSRAAFQRDKAWGLLEDKRRRIEATYEAVEHHREAYGELLTSALVVMAGQKTLITNLTKVPWPKLRMLVHLYLPEMLPELDAIEKAGNHFGTEASRMIGNPSLANTDQGRRAPLEAYDQLHKAYDDFVVKLVTLGATLASSAAQATQPRLPWFGRRPAKSLPDGGTRAA
jgi:hypothetical protein